MQRLIRSFNTLTDALKDTLQEQYPDGIDSSHIKTIPTAAGDTLRVIELKTPDALYLIKINPESREEIEQFLDEGSDDDDVGGSDDIAGGDDADVEDDTADDADDDDDDADDDVADADDGDDEADE